MQSEETRSSEMRGYQERADKIGNKYQGTKGAENTNWKTLRVMADSKNGGQVSFGSLSRKRRHGIAWVFSVLGAFHCWRCAFLLGWYPWSPTGTAAVILTRFSINFCPNKTRDIVHGQVLKKTIYISGFRSLLGLSWQHVLFLESESGMKNLPWVC